MSNARKGQLYRSLTDLGWQPDKHYRNYTQEELEALLMQIAPADKHRVDDEPSQDELPGARMNTKLPDEVIHVDSQGRQWLQKEMQKPAYPKPRGRRVLTYMEPGTVEETVVNGEYTETFEVAGKGRERPSEVKITLPSYQVGIYRDPRFPFKVRTYGGREGFDLQDVETYYGGPELVPTTVKRVYIESDLCYDIRSVIAAIRAEHRQLQLSGRIK